MIPLHSCVVCVYKRMLKHGDAWWPAFVKDNPSPPNPFRVPVCERHEPELMGRAIAYETPRIEPSRVEPARGHELYPQGSDA